MKNLDKKFDEEFGGENEHFLNPNNSEYIKSFINTYYIGRKEVKNTVTLYMKALGTEKLSEKTWKKLARVNQIVLDK